MGGMTELAPSLVELARRFGIATELRGLEPAGSGRSPSPRWWRCSPPSVFAAGTEQERNAALTARTAVVLGPGIAADHRRAHRRARRGSGCM